MRLKNTRKLEQKHKKSIKMMYFLLGVSLGMYFFGHVFDANEKQQGSNKFLVKSNMINKYGHSEQNRNHILRKKNNRDTIGFSQSALSKKNITTRKHHIADGTIEFDEQVMFMYGGDIILRVEKKDNLKLVKKIFIDQDLFHGPIEFSLSMAQLNGYVSGEYLLRAHIDIDRDQKFSPGDYYSPKPLLIQRKSRFFNLKVTLVGSEAYKIDSNKN